ncbi:MAG: TatD family hydrolase [Myxococcota bacterium]|nr:TatD family hydrolase [Myxococcota bacterium]
MFIDIGLNLTSSQFDRDRQDVLSRAFGAGVQHMIVTGTSIEESEQAVLHARAYPGRLSATAGIHPHDAKSFDEHSLDQLRDLCSAPETVAVGECGLDFNRDFSPRDAQQRCFSELVQLAIETRLPLFLHQRDAHDAFMEILSPMADQVVGGVVHCFTGTADQLDAYLDMGMFIGITGWVCDERRGLQLRELLPHIPLDRLLIETDAPYLIPRDLSPKPKSRRNEPMFLPHIAKIIAAAVDVELDELARITRANTKRLFKLD